MSSFTYLVNQTLRTCFGRPRPRTAAVILAAGQGSRFSQTAKTDTAKQFLCLAGVPVFLRSVQAFEDCEYIDEIILVVRPEDEAEMRRILDEDGIKKVTAIVHGGETRQESAFRGFSALSARVGYVAFHDAARCLITSAAISDVVAAAYAHRAATAACRVQDTVKRSNMKAEIVETIDRESLWLAQTPQVFETDLYRYAMHSAKKEGVVATDDNALLERLGQTVRLIDVGKGNLKITTAEDAVIAEALLRQSMRKG